MTIRINIHISQLRNPELYEELMKRPAGIARASLLKQLAEEQIRLRNAPHAGSIDNSVINQFQLSPSTYEFAHQEEGEDEFNESLLSAELMR